MKKVTQSFLVLSMYVFLNACVTQQTITIPENIEPNNGVVGVRIIPNSSTFERAEVILFNSWENVLVINSADEEFYLTLSESPARNNSQLFVGALPDGLYKLDSLISPMFHRRIVSKLLGYNIEFEIKAGHLTSLGTLIYQPIGGNAFTVISEFDDPAIVEMVVKEYPQLNSGFSQNTILKPTQSSENLVFDRGSSDISILPLLADVVGATEKDEKWLMEKDPKKRLIIAKNNSYAFNDVQELDTGEIFVASNLGQILVRSITGIWSRIETGHLSELTAINVIDKNNILVGGENGLLLNTSNGGESWETIQTPRSNSLILDISYFVDEHIILNRVENGLVVNSINDLTSNQWNELIFIEGEKDNLNGWTGTSSINKAMNSGSATIKDGKYIVLSPHGFTHILDIEKRVWRKYSLPKKGFSRLRNHNDGFLYATQFRHPYISNDDGMSWEKHKHGCLRYMDLWYGPNGTGYNLCFQGALVVSNNIQKQSGRNTSWGQLQTELPDLAHTMYVSDKSKLLLYVNVSGLVYGSEDDGKTWHLEKGGENKPK